MFEVTGSNEQSAATTGHTVIRLLACYKILQEKSRCLSHMTSILDIFRSFQELLLCHVYC